MHQRLSSLFWLMIGIYTTIGAYRLGLGSFRQPGRGLIFFLAASILVFLSVVDLMGAFTRKLKTGGDEEKPLWSGVRWGKILLVLGGLLAFVYFFNPIGFALSTFLLLVFLFKTVEPTRWWVAVMGSVIITFSAYAIFKMWLKVPFPEGFLGF